MGSKAPSKVTQTNKVELSPEQKQLFDLGMPFAQQYASQPLDMYSGQTIADFSPYEMIAQGKYTQGADQFAKLGQQGYDAQKFLLSPDQLSPTANPFAGDIAKLISKGIGDEFSRSVLPNIQASGVQSGGMYGTGGTRQQMAERVATEGVGNSIGDALKKFYFDNYQLGIANMQKAIGQNRQVGLDLLMPGDIYSMVGGQQRQMEQLKMDDAYRKWAIEQQLPFLRAQEIMGLVNGMPGGTGVTQVNGASPQGNPLTGALGGAMGGASMASMLGMGGAVGGPIGAILGALLGVMMNR